MTTDEAVLREQAIAAARDLMTNRSLSAADEGEDLFDRACTTVTLLAPYYEQAEVSDDEMDELDAQLRERP